MLEKPSGRVRALIVDDEAPARSNIRVLLNEDRDVEIVGECDSGAKALEALRTLKPDLLFLDIQMPECDGFDVVEMAGNDLPSAVIFVTAYDEYAIRAFDAGALDYLLKPFDDKRFRVALERAKDKLEHRGREVEERTLAIKGTRQIRFIKEHEIDRIEAADYYACLHVGTKTHLLRRSLADLEQELDAKLFCRIHRSTIVNVSRVRALELGEDGDYEVILDGGARLKMSRRYRKNLLERMPNLS